MSLSGTVDQAGLLDLAARGFIPPAADLTPAMERGSSRICAHGEHDYGGPAQLQACRASCSGQLWSTTRLWKGYWKGYGTPAMIRHSGAEAGTA